MNNIPSGNVLAMETLILYYLLSLFWGVVGTHNLEICGLPVLVLSRFQQLEIRCEMDQCQSIMNLPKAEHSPTSETCSHATTPEFIRPHLWPTSVAVSEQPGPPTMAGVHDVVSV